MVQGMTPWDLDLCSATGLGLGLYNRAAATGANASRPKEGKTIFLKKSFERTCAMPYSRLCSDRAQHCSSLLLLKMVSATQAISHLSSSIFSPERVFLSLRCIIPFLTLLKSPTKSGDLMGRTVGPNYNLKTTKGKGTPARCRERSTWKDSPSLPLGCGTWKISPCPIL